MDQGQIIAGLKKLGGPIKGVKIHVETEPIMRKEVRPAQTWAQVDVDLQSIIDKILPPFAVLRDDRGVVHDATTVAVKCRTGHLHKYLLRDIQAAGLTKCATCNTGNAFTTMARNNIENILGVPFVKVDSARGLDITFNNPLLKIKLVCAKVNGADDCTMSDGVFSLKIHKTTSEKKIRESIFNFLRKYEGLPEQYRAKLYPPAKAQEPYIKNSLPVSPELAKLIGPGGEVVESKNLYLEKCGQ